MYEFIRADTPIMPMMVCTAAVTLNYDNVQAVGESHV
jgi:hypothetical protein